jgi:hypothetical protein
MVKSATACLLAAGCAVTASAQQSGTQYFRGLADLSLYLKPRFNTPNLWDQQGGLRARLMRSGNASAEYSLAYDPYYPIKFNNIPRWTTGIQFAYFFTKLPIPIAVYTTPKYNLVNTWKEEFGLNFRFLQTRRVYVNSSLDYQPTFPYVEKQKSVFQASLTVGFPLGG